LSSNAGTARGFGIGEFQSIGRWIARVLQTGGAATEIKNIRAQTRALCAAFPIY